MPNIFDRIIWTNRLRQYLLAKPRIRARLGFEIDRPLGSQSGVWLFYDHWPSQWKNRLVDFCIAYEHNTSLPKENSLPLAPTDVLLDTSLLGYRTAEIARDTYLAQVAYAIWLDIKHTVPWRLEDWSDNELSYLLSSHVCFSAYRTWQDNTLYYIVYIGSRIEATENILDDPRIAHRFMLADPEQGKQLVGSTPNETGQFLSEWFHDYLWHNPGGFPAHTFHRNHPLLSDRFTRYDVPPIGKVYVTTAGCSSASSLFADLMRSVNIPVRKVINAIDSFTNTEEHHIGLLFDWQGGTDSSRYLLHTDDLYTSSYFKDPAPTPAKTDRGVALWNHVWLDSTRFGQYFSYDSRPNILGKATSDQKVIYWEKGDWLVSSAQAVQAARSMGKKRTIAFLEKERHFSRSEAEECWNHVEASVLAYGNGNMTLGYQRLLDGPDSRHGQWCTRTGKC